MARIVRCPICEKTKKIKHNHYVNFTCCHIKFPISEHDVIRKEFGDRESQGCALIIKKATAETPLREPREPKVLHPIEKPRKTAMTEEEADEAYSYKCGKCGSWFNEFEEGCCPNEKCRVKLDIS